MGITISSSSSSEDSVKINSKKSQRFETKEARHADRETRRVEREAKREARKNHRGGKVSIPENSSSTPPVSGSTGNSGQSQSTSSQTSSANSTSIPTPPSKSKPFSIGDLNGANVVNFAVQGKAGGSSDFSVFASGKGPGAIDPTKKATSSTTTTTTASSATPEANTGTTVNTTA